MLPLLLVGLDGETRSELVGEALVLLFGVVGVGGLLAGRDGGLDVGFNFLRSLLLELDDSPSLLRRLESRDEILESGAGGVPSLRKP